MATAATTMASAATNAMTQKMNTFLATHFNEINAATTAMMAHNNARGLVEMAWDDLKQIFLKLYFYIFFLLAEDIY